MNQLEKDIRKRFVDQQIETADVKDQMLWDNISGQLDLAVSTRNITNVWILTFLLLFITSVGVYFTWQSSMGEKMTFQQDRLEQVPREAAMSHHSQIIDFGSLQIPLTNSTTASKATISSVKNEKNLSEKTNSVLYTPARLESSKQTAGKENRQAQNDSFSNEMNGSLVEGNRSGLNKGAKLNTLQLLKPQLNGGLKRASLLSPGLRLLHQSSSISEDVDRTAWSAELWSGPNFLNIAYVSQSEPDLANRRTSLEDGSLGWSTGLLLSRKLNSRMSLSTGFSYHNLFNKFEIYKESEYYETRENQLVHVVINSATGDTLEAIYADTTVLVNSQHHIRHYDRYQLYSIPVLVGFTKEFGQVTLTLNAGPVINFATQQSGRTIALNEQITDFTADHPAAPFNKVTVGGIVRSSLSLQINNSLAVTFSPSYHFSAHKSVNNGELKSLHHRIMLPVGLKVNF